MTSYQLSSNDAFSSWLLSVERVYKYFFERWANVRFQKQISFFQNVESSSSIFTIIAAQIDREAAHLFN